ncbi:predicted protein [Chaetoceros tenuissimus]|uniref:Uncharacterized protein n=1 Tax=Chaetoceros tenuissimus TaxID=426638 RepID=A0AAD3HFG0_9STRA|nr:predicted protein [Chaetoceros tenuissimus]
MVAYFHLDLFTCSSIIWSREKNDQSDANGAMCTLAPSPIGCDRNDDVECIRGKGANFFGAITMVTPVGVVFASSLLTVLGAFTLHVYTSEKQLQPTRKDKNSKKRSETKQNTPVEQEQSEENQNNKEEMSARYEKQALKLYSGPLVAFLFRYAHGVVGFFWVSLFFPLGGLFNISIRPKAQALRKIIEISRFLGIIEVVVAGGETPNVMDYISFDNPEDNDDQPSTQGRNSAHQRAYEAFGIYFEDDYDIDEEVE